MIRPTAQDLKQREWRLGYLKGGDDVVPASARTALTAVVYG